MPPRKKLRIVAASADGAAAPTPVGRKRPRLSKQAAAAGPVGTGHAPAAPALSSDGRHDQARDVATAPAAGPAAGSQGQAARFTQRLATPNGLPVLGQASSAGEPASGQRQGTASQRRLPGSARAARQGQQEQAEAPEVPPQERDVHKLLQLFQGKVQGGAPAAFATFKEAWTELCFSYVFEGCVDKLGMAEYVQSLFAAALDCLDHPIPPPPAPPAAELTTASGSAAQAQLAQRAQRAQQQHGLPPRPPRPASRPSSAAGASRVAASDRAGPTGFLSRAASSARRQGAAGASQLLDLASARRSQPVSARPRSAAAAVASTAAAAAAALGRPPASGLPAPGDPARCSIPTAQPMDGAGTGLQELASVPSVPPNDAIAASRMSGQGAAGQELPAFAPVPGTISTAADVVPEPLDTLLLPSGADLPLPDLDLQSLPDLDLSLPNGIGNHVPPPQHVPSGQLLADLLLEDDEAENEEVLPGSAVPCQPQPFESQLNAANRPVAVQQVTPGLQPTPQPAQSQPSTSQGQPFIATFLQPLTAQAASKPALVSFELRLGALYALYTLYETQPGLPTVRIYLPLECLEQLVGLVAEAKARGAVEAAAVVQKLFKAQAFVTGAVRRPPQGSAAARLAKATVSRVAAAADRVKESEVRQLATTHLTNTMAELAGLQHLQLLCNSYRKRKARVFGAGDVGEEPEAIADMELGEELHKLVSSTVESIKAILAGTFEPGRASGSRRRGVQPPNGSPGAAGDAVGDAAGVVHGGSVADEGAAAELRGSPRQRGRPRQGRLTPGGLAGPPSQQRAPETDAAAKMGTAAGRQPGPAPRSRQRPKAPLQAPAAGRGMRAAAADSGNPDPDYDPGADLDDPDLDLVEPDLEDLQLLDAAAADTAEELNSLPAAARRVLRKQAEEAAKVQRVRQQWLQRAAAVRQDMPSLPGLPPHPSSQRPAPARTTAPQAAQHVATAGAHPADGIAEPSAATDANGGAAEPAQAEGLPAYGGGDSVDGLANGSGEAGARRAKQAQRAAATQRAPSRAAAAAAPSRQKAGRGAGLAVQGVAVPGGAPSQAGGAGLPAAAGIQSSSQKRGWKAKAVAAAAAAVEADQVQGACVPAAAAGFTALADSGCSQHSGDGAEAADEAPAAAASKAPAAPGPDPNQPTGSGAQDEEGPPRKRARLKQPKAKTPTAGAKPTRGRKQAVDPWNPVPDVPAASAKSAGVQSPRRSRATAPPTKGPSTKASQGGDAGPRATAGAGASGAGGSGVQQPKRAKRAEPQPPPPATATTPSSTEQQPQQSNGAEATLDQLGSLSAADFEAQAAEADALLDSDLSEGGA